MTRLFKKESETDTNGRSLNEGSVKPRNLKSDHQEGSSSGVAERSAALLVPEVFLPGLSRSAVQSKDEKVSYEQKSKISSMINTLSESKMVMALKIIRDNMPELKGVQADEVELDIDELSNDVLRKLSVFLQAQAPQPDDAPEKKMSKPACSVDNYVYEYLFGNKDVAAMAAQGFLDGEHLRLAEKKTSEAVEEHKKAKKELRTRKWITLT